MNKSAVNLLAAGLLLAAAGLSPARAEDAPRGMTMRIQQDILLGTDSAAGDYRACFLSPDRFRVEGTKRLKTAKSDVVAKESIAGDGAVVRQIEKVGDSTKAYVVDLDRVRKELPWADYSSAKTYDPSVYAGILKDAKDRKVLPAEDLDGAPAEGYELALPNGRRSLPFNVPMVLPDPVKVRFWVNPKDGIARKVELEDAQGHVFLKTRYTDVKTDAQLRPETFELEFPKDVVPLDLTNIVIRGVEATRRPPTPAAPTPAEKQP